jgi:hypothetical protein
MPSSYTLQKTYIFSITLPTGKVEIENGKIINNPRVGGHYSSQIKSFRTGKTIPSIGMVTLTLYFNRRQKNGTPHSLTCYGTHDSTTGMEDGTVVAASSLHKSKIGKLFKRNLNIVTIG